MASFLQSIPPLVVEVYDFSNYERIVDVGSAHGTLMTAVLKANPSPRGVLFDLPHVVDGARQPLAAGLADRCDFVPATAGELPTKNHQNIILARSISLYCLTDSGGISVLDGGDKVDKICTGCIVWVECALALRRWPALR
jgi:hypothetical protein